jgi:Holliday junction resolvasome RuvABC endonuclease subunit
MRVLGLDLSTKTGYAVVDSSDGLIAYDKLEYSTDESFPLEEYRYIHISQRIASGVRDVLGKYPTDAIVIEQVNLGRNRHSQKFLDFIHYAVLQMLRDVDYKGIVAYADTSAWRKELGIRLSKEQRIHNKMLNASKRRGDNQKSGTKKGDGKVTWKHLSVGFVNSKFGLDLKLVQNDIADAICLGLYGLSITPNSTSDNIKIDASTFNG